MVPERERRDLALWNHLLACFLRVGLVCTVWIVEPKEMFNGLASHLKHLCPCFDYTVTSLIPLILKDVSGSYWCE